MKSRHLLLLGLILAAGILLRWLYVDICPTTDRGAIALGMINNLPPLYHQLSAPFYELTGNLWYAPAIPNILMSAAAMILLYFMGAWLADRKLGLLLAFVFAIFPAAILNSRNVSPEMTELFFIILICFFFVKLEVLNDRRQHLFLVLFALAIMIGAFSKQQTLLILVPLYFYGLYKHRLGIFSRPAYYIMPIAAIPYLLFLFSNPQLLGSILVYFTKQPSTASVGIGTRLLTMLTKHLVFSLLYLAVLLFAFMNLRRIKKAVGRDMLVFTLLLLMTYHAFFLKIDVYYHLVIFPIVLLSGFALYTMKSPAIEITAAVLLVATVAGQAMLIPRFSYVSLTFCEGNMIERPFIHELTGYLPDGSTYLMTKTEFIDNILGDDRYIILGGDVGQEWKYWLKQRIYYPSVINSERFKEVNYALIYSSPDRSLNSTYTNSPSWDAPYVALLFENSRIISVDEDGGRQIYLLQIQNHDITVPDIEDFRTRSRTSLALTDGQNQS